ncbi:MAG: hypothetical protein NWE76_02355 [Candidatus Bathyarchaeota archaeon]|nr:hypothetical protein [Candidatus Bathyarchaeota archaeon]
MSDLGEPRILCPSCGKPAPAMKYCIYCGANLPQAAPTTVMPPEPRPSIPPPVPPIIAPPKAPPTTEPVPPLTPAGVKDEVGSLMSDITALYERKVALLDLFQSGQVSERVFLKLYSEYGSNLDGLLKARSFKMDEMRSRLDENSNRVNEVTMRLEELEVRRKIGEIDANVYSQKVENLRAEETQLNDSVKTLRANVERLEKMLAEKKPSEIRDLEANLRTYHGAFDKLLEEGKVSTETYDAVRSGTEETLEFFESLIKERKEEEKNIREQLETLQTRYKLSELSIEEYEGRKRELQAELDKIWA